MLNSIVMERARSLYRSVMFTLVAIAVTIGALELLTPMIFEWRTGQSLKQATRALLTSHIEVDDGGELFEVETTDYQDKVLGMKIVHPYFGYVMKPGTGAINKHGFWGDLKIRVKEEGVVNVALVGGSVANQIYRTRDVLSSEFKATFPGKKISFLSFAAGAYSQPQQLMVLAYYLSQGANIDVVINIDGHNEVIATYVNTEVFKNHPLFPEYWNLMASSSFNPELVRAGARIIKLRDKLSWWRRSITSVALIKYSNFATAVTLVRSSAISKEIGEMFKKLNDMTNRSDQIVGPPHKYTPENRYQLNALHWRKSSQLIKALCDSVGIEYFHFLQPNQYVPGSKIFSDAETKIAKTSFSVGARSIAAGYEAIKAETKELTSSGVNFEDLSMIFKNEERPVYSDSCCHFNELGRKTIAREVARFVVDKLKTK